MKYLLYTDGAYSQSGRVAFAYVLRTQLMFYHMAADTYENGTILHAEAAAVGLGVRYILDNCEITSEDSVEIFTDNLEVIRIFTDFENQRSSKVDHPLIQMTWSALCELNKRCSWKIKKIQAHMNSINANSTADRLAKFALRMRAYEVHEYLQALEEKKNRKEAKAEELPSDGK